MLPARVDRKDPGPEHPRDQEPGESRPRRPTVFRTTTFRIALLYLVLFGISVLALLGFVYWTTAGFTARQSDETINAEITGLAEQYRRDGLARLVQVVLERSRNQRQSLYLIAGPNKAPLAGNLEAWPPVETAARSDAA